MGVGIILVLAVLQGLTEFLPVSSSGHLVLAQRFFHLEDPDQNLAVVIALHVGSLAAILIYYRRDFLRLFTDRRRETGYLLLGSIPAGIAGFTLLGAVAEFLTSPEVVCVALMVNGAFLWTAELAAKEPREFRSWWKALIVGAAQVAGLVPGISRSGSTIGTALLLRVRPPEAVRFSFFLGAIAIFGAGLKSLLDGQGDAPILPIVVGVIVSFAVSLAAIRMVAVLAERRKLRWFGVYCAAVGLAALSFTLL